MLHPFNRSGLKRLEARMLSLFLRAMTHVLGFRTLVVIHQDFYSADYVDFFPDAINAYDCLDDHAHFPWSNPQTRSMEDELTRRCDVVLAVSDRLVRSRQALCPNTFLVPNAADLEHFSQASSPDIEDPPDMAPIPRPVLGFIGSLYEWVDYDLLAYLARAHREWSIVLIGPARTSLKILDGVPNVYLLGEREYAKLPAYLHAFDVALVPFRTGPLAQSADVIKVYEYLSAGKPVVATDIPTVRRFRGVVSIAVSFDSFEAAVRRALGDVSPERVAARQLAVQEDSWKARVASIENILRSAVASRRAEQRIH
jgi:glycosyltransferase involved in cell wall biosynthesis